MDSSSPLSTPRGSPPSSPLSNLSKTPSLPGSPLLPLDHAKRYPSPPMSMSADSSGTQSPVKPGHQTSSSQRMASDDGSPPAKRRKTAQPKERTTEYLDLTKPNDELTDEETHQMDRLLTALRKKKKIVVIAGAGISVSAGIPDFRSSNGLFATTRKQHNVKSSGKHLFDASVYKHGSSTQSFHTMVREMSEMTNNASPTPFHHLLASLAQEGRLLRLYSQNIDCIDTRMQPLATNVPLNLKGPWPATVQLHGGLEKMVCTKCGELSPFEAEIFDGPEPPLCETCKVQDQVRTAHAGKRSHGIGRLRPRFVLYNEYNPDEEAIGNVSSADLRARPDAVIVVGTTLKVPGTRRLVKELCQVTRGRKDGFTAWINISPEPKGVDFKDCWDLVVRSKCDNVAQLTHLPPWDMDIGDDYLIPKDEVATGAGKTTIEVNIPSSVPSPASEDLDESKPKTVEELQAMPTPRPSPKPAAAKAATKPTQSKLQFAKTADEQEPAKTKTKANPRARKPKQAKNGEPKKTVMDTFKAAKNVPGNATKKAGKNGTGNPNFTTDTFRVSLPGSKDAKPKEQEDVIDIKVEQPTTPTMLERQLSRETISPPSVPKAMRALID
ncbi:hypothetical protein K4F52_007264 [Lecanicillium sp. MT-2017a]|nr:hypothetical protein K4F52_007264 [Lecanicillium sp. MT-2017a]